MGEGRTWLLVGNIAAMDVDQLGPDALADLRRVVDGRWADVRAAVREQLPPEWCRPVGDLDREAQRAVTLERATVLAGWDLPRRGFETAYGGEDDIGGSMTLYEMLGLVDLSLMVKAGVQWGLFGGALQALGTRKPPRALPAADHDPRAAGLLRDDRVRPRLGRAVAAHHGDVRRGATGVRHQHPDDDARKDYIGNAARDGRIAVVFAQLVTQGESHGVHAVLVPIRDERDEPCPGIRIEDCGHKGGLNGVDNGRLWFDDVRVPRDALLDRYGQVAADGTYSSPIESRSQRFFTMLGALVRGPGQRRRCGGCSSAGRAGHRGGARRERARSSRAPGSDGEVTVLDYLAHQRRLLPALATSYALHFAQGELTSDLHDVQTGGTDDDARQRELESRAAGLKAISTWHATADHPGLPRGVRRCRLPRRSTGWCSSRPTPTCSRPSRATTPC